MRKISIAIPSYNRFEQTIASFDQVLDDERIAEVVIVDDASTDGSSKKLLDYIWQNGKELLYKVFLYINEVNQDCYKNKHTAMKESYREFVILLDSDNKIDTSYLDAIYAIPEWDAKTIYQPSFSRPHFDFRKWSGLTLTKENVAEYIRTYLMTALNAMNFFINRDEYLKVWDGSVNPHTSDSIYFCYCWLAAGNKIHITPNLEYDHFIDPNGKGHYQTNWHKTGNFHKDLMTKINELR